MTKRKFHNMVRKSKTAYKNDILEKMHLSNKKEPKKLRRLLDKMNGRANRKYQSNISAENWINYFKSIFNSVNGNPLPKHFEQGGLLDYEITLEETMDAHKYLQQGKAPGSDNITNEMLICSVKFYPCIFLYVFNHILKLGGQIPSWAVFFTGSDL